MVELRHCLEDAMTGRCTVSESCGEHIGHVDLFLIIYSNGVLLQNVSLKTNIPTRSWLCMVIYVLILGLQRDEN